jgi:curved DNA-binding protein
MKFQDYYETLGVPRSAGEEDIKRAYRKLALKWHPDRHKADTRQQAEDRFKRISEAYEVLSDPEKRRKYDQFGEHWKQGQEFTPPPGAGGARRMSREEFESMFGGGGGAAGGGFSDFFANIFGEQFGRDVGGGGRRHARFSERGADVQAELALGLGDALAGGKRHFEIPAASPCPRCGGTGFVSRHVCPVCVGVGTVQRRRTVELTLPRPVRDGQTLRLRGLGEPGDGGEAGDLLLTLRLQGDETFRLDGTTIEADVPLAPWEALAGARVDVRTPEGTVTLNVPAGTRAGARLRLRGRGLDDGQGGRGDFLAVVRLALPDDLSPEQRELLARAGAAGPAAVRGGARGAP